MKREDIVKAAKLCLNTNSLLGPNDDCCEQCPFGDKDDDVIGCCESFLEAVCNMNFDDPSSEVIKISKDHMKNFSTVYPTRALQLQIAQEECNELAVAISKLNRADEEDKYLQGDHNYKELRANLVEEVAHVAIMLCMLKLRFGITQKEIDAECLKKDVKYGFTEPFEQKKDSNGGNKVDPAWLPFYRGEKVKIFAQLLPFNFSSILNYASCWHYDVTIKSDEKSFSMSPCGVSRRENTMSITHGENIFRFIKSDHDYWTYDRCYRRSYER